MISPELCSAYHLSPCQDVRIYLDITFTHSLQHWPDAGSQDRRIRASVHQHGPCFSHSLFARLRNFAPRELEHCNPGFHKHTGTCTTTHTDTWAIGQLGTWHWHRHKHTRQSQRGLTRKGESLATNLGDCLVVASGRWCCCTEVFHVASHGRICSSSSGSRVRNHWRKAPHHQGLFAGTFNP